MFMRLNAGMPSFSLGKKIMKFSRTPEQNYHSRSCSENTSRRPSFLFGFSCPTMMVQRLSHDLAARIVTEWRNRVASDFACSHNVAYCAHDFVPTWNTLCTI
jgi:hypothetical protein